MIVPESKELADGPSNSLALETVPAPGPYALFVALSLALLSYALFLALALALLSYALFLALALALLG
ncbi:unnamed protein product [Arctogadus glacialis]